MTALVGREGVGDGASRKGGDWDGASLKGWVGVTALVGLREGVGDGASRKGGGCDGASLHGGGGAALV